MSAQWLSSVYASVGIPQSGLQGTCNQEEWNLVGRVTNGLTLADFYAQWLGLQVPPPYLLFNQTEKHTEGFNYASGPAGIRPETSTVDHGVFLSMDKQVELFKKTAQEYLPTLFGNPDELKDYLSKSIFLVVIGRNDYTQNFLSPKYNSSSKWNMKQFAEIIVDELGSKILVSPFSPIRSKNSMSCFYYFILYSTNYNMSCVQFFKI
ncbi:gdsl esterase/lipase [Quercus suber]|uniref:Gdsl esterase/lipase n=1 Tax=Quercus suber TaxID=58331 RepID=A0AAW0ICP7_QUESU